MRKVILKVKLSSRDRFETKLADINLDFSPILWQHDRVYIPKNYRPSQNFPRLVMRTEIKAVDRPPRYLLILKRHITDSGIDIVEETTVKDYASVVNIILQLGFKPAGELSRRRQTLNMGEGTLIHLDKLDNHPSYFAKIESILTPTDSVTSVRLDLEKTFQTLDEHHFIPTPYFEITN